MNVSIILSLIDRMTGPARRVASTWRQTAQQVTAASRQMQSSSGGVVTAFKRAGAAAADAAAHVNRYLRSLSLATRARGPGFVQGAAAGRMMGGGGGLGFITIPAAFSAALDAAKAENKFRALVDSVTPEQMVDIQSGILARIRKSGENYAVVMDAAANAAQIVGDATKAFDITITSSKLANIDTKGRDVAYFADSIAAILGKSFVPEDLKLIGNMMAEQQKLGAATAAGTLDAYKKMAPYKALYGFRLDEALASIGVIKNLPGMAATDDGTLGAMGEYGLRLFNSITPEFRKKLRTAGVKRTDLFTDGAFDIAKAQAFFYNMAQTQKGNAKLRDLFAGKNVQGSRYWLSLAQVKPEDFLQYVHDLYRDPESLNKSDEERFKGIVGVWNRIKTSFWEIGRAVGDTLAPALSIAADYMERFSQRATSGLKWFRESYPQITKWGGALLGGFGLLRMLSLFSPRLAAFSGWLVRLPLLLARLGAALGFGAFVGLVRLGVEFGRMGGSLLRVGVVAGFAARAFRFLGKSLLFGAAIEGGFWLYDNWDKIKATLRDPIRISVVWPEAPEWLKWLVPQAVKSGKKQAEQERQISNRIHAGWRRTMPSWLGGRDPSDQGTLNQINPAQPYRGAGIPPILQSRARNAQASSMARESVSASPKGITVQANGPQVIFKQAPPSVNVTVNAVTNADAGSIGASAGNAVGAAMRGATGLDGN